MDSALFRSPLSRYIVAGVSVVSLVLFGTVWIATLVTSGFSLAGTHTYAGWTYLPLFWFHLAAATLGFMIFFRYGANSATGIVVIFLWVIAWVSDFFGAVSYWRLFWLCNISGKDKLTGLAVEICASENALLISMMVFGTVMWFITWAGAIAHGFDYFQASRSGKSMPGRKITPQLLWVATAGVLTLLVFLGLWIANLITSGMSWAAGTANQTFGVWAHINIFLVQLSAGVVSVMLSLRYGANAVTAAAAIILWSVSFFAGTYGTVLYWRLGWFCKIATGTTLQGVDLVICTQEDSYLIALWVLVSILWLLTIVGAVAHAFDFMDASKVGGLGLKRGGRSEDGKSVDGLGVAPTDDQGVPRGEQYGTFDDGNRVFAAARLATNPLRRAAQPVMQRIGSVAAGPSDTARGWAAAAGAPPQKRRNERPQRRRRSVVPTTDAV